MSDTTGMVPVDLYNKAIREAAAIEQMLMFTLIENGQQEVRLDTIETVDLRDYEFQRLRVSKKYVFRCIKVRNLTEGEKQQ